MDKTDKILRTLQRRPEEKTPIGTEIFIPNHSGDHSAGIVNTVPTVANDIVNKSYADGLVSNASNWNTAYSHSQNNTQAHSDYLLNTGDTATGDYNFDSNTFVIDSTNNRVGVGTVAPSENLTVSGTGNVVTRIETTSDDAALLRLVTPDGSYAIYSSNDVLYLYSATLGDNFLTALNTGYIGLGIAPIVPLQVHGMMASANLSDHAENVLISYDEGTQSGNIESWNTSTGGKPLSLNYRGGNVGIGNSNPGAKLHVTGTDGIIIPIGTTAQRVATQGMIRYNTTTSKFEGYTGAGWVDFH